jgi:hypothetical protein
MVFVGKLFDPEGNTTERENIMITALEFFTEKQVELVEDSKSKWKTF